MLESWAQNHQYTIQAIVALGTWAAIVISIWFGAWSLILSKKQFKQDIKSEIAVVPHFIDRSTGFVLLKDANVKCISIMVKNVGHVDVNLDQFSFYFKLPFIKAPLIQIPVDHDFDIKKTIKPRTSEIFVISESLDSTANQIFGWLKGHKKPLFLSRFLKCRIETLDNTVFEVDGIGSFKRIVRSVGVERNTQ